MMPEPKPARLPDVAVECAPFCRVLGVHNGCEADPYVHVSQDEIDRHERIAACPCRASTRKQSEPWPACNCELRDVDLPATARDIIAQAIWTAEAWSPLDMQEAENHNSHTLRAGYAITYAKADAILEALKPLAPAPTEARAPVAGEDWVPAVGERVRVRKDWIDAIGIVRENVGGTWPIRVAMDHKGPGGTERQLGCTLSELERAPAEPQPAREEPHDPTCPSALGTGICACGNARCQTCGDHPHRMVGVPGGSIPCPACASAGGKP